jgi:hypothetical protein
MRAGKQVFNRYCRSTFLKTLILGGEKLVFESVAYSRMMVFEALGECMPRSSIVDRLSFLCEYSKSLVVSKPIALCDVVAITNRITRSLGFPRITGETIISTIGEINKTLRSNLNRRLPTLVNLEGPPAGYSHFS